MATGEPNTFNASEVNMSPLTVSLLTSDVKHIYAHPQLTYSPMQTMGERIRTLRESKGWTQQDLAERVGVSREAVSQWEIGPTKNIKNVTFLALLKELGTTYEYLMFGPDERPRTDTPSKPRRAGGSGNRA